MTLSPSPAALSPRKGNLLHKLSSSASAMALMLAMSAGGTLLTSTAAMAACAITYPDGTSAQVVCDTSAPHPVTGGVAPDATGNNFTTHFDIADGVVIQNVGGPALTVDYSGFATDNAGSAVMVGSEANRDRAFAIGTTGDDAHAILVDPRRGGSGDASGYVFEFYGEATVSTTGTGSSGIFLTSPVGEPAPVSGSVINNFNTSIKGGEANPLKITTQGDDAAGVYAGERVGGRSQVELQMDNVEIATGGRDAVGIEWGGATDYHSRAIADFNRVMITTQGDGSAGIIARMTNGDVVPPSGMNHGYGFGISRAYLQDSSIQTSGNDAAGVILGDPNASRRQDDGYPDGGDQYSYVGTTTISTEGDDSAGLVVHGAVQNIAGGIFGVDVGDTTIITFGDHSTAAFLNFHPQTTDRATHRAGVSGLMIETHGEGSTGLHIGDDPTPAVRPAPRALNSDIAIAVTDSEIETEKADSTGMLLGWHDGHLAEMVGSDLSYSVSDTTVTTTGDNSTGIDLRAGGVRIENSEYEVTFSGLDVSTEGDDADAIRLDVLSSSVTDGTTVAINLSDLKIETAGERSVGLRVGDNVNALSTLADATVTVALDELTVTTGGLEAHGIVLAPRLGVIPADTNSSNTLALTGIAATTAGDAAHALLANVAGGTSMALTVDGASSYTATGTGSAGIYFDSTGAAATTGVALAIDAGASVTGELGAIVFDGTSADVVNAGALIGTNGVAVRFDTDAAAVNTFELHTTGTVSGQLLGGAGQDSFILAGDTGSATFDAGQLVDFDAYSKVGEATWTLTGTNFDFSNWQYWDVLGGTLLIDGNLESWMFRNNGQAAVIGGSGHAGDIELTANGRLAPGPVGNAIGHLEATHYVGFESGSVYVVDVAADGNADRVIAPEIYIYQGSAVEVFALDPATSYTDGQRYLILDAASVGGYVDGTFDSASMLNESAFITPTLSYENALGGSVDPDQVWLTLSLDRDFTTAAETFNQLQAASGLSDLEQTGGALAVFNTIAAMNADDARRAFDLSSGEIHASGQHVIDQTFALFNRTLRYQGVAGIGAGNVGAETFTAPLGYGPAVSRGNEGVVAIDGATDYADARVRGAWAAPLGGFGRIDGDGNAGELKWWNGGLAGGYEGVIDLGAGNAVGGLGFGYIRSHGSVDARLSSFDSDGFYLGAYGAWADGPWTVAGSLSYGANRISTERNIAFMGTTAEASYWMHSIGLSGEASYAFDLADTTRIAPLFTLDAGWSGHGGFNETGAGALNLSSGSESWARFDAGLGLAVTHAIMTESGRITLEGRAVWEHAFADVVPSQALTLAGSPTGFTVHGPAADRNRLRLGAGLSWDVSEDMTVRARYDGLFSGDQNNHTASFGLNIRF